MKLNRMASRWGRSQRNDINFNWDEIERSYRPLLNLGRDAEKTLIEAYGINAEAKKVNKENLSVQRQIDVLTAESGTSDAEVLQARVDYAGFTHVNLRQRNNDTDDRLLKSVDYADSGRSILNKRKHDKRALVSFIVDDGSISDYTKLKPIFEAKNISAGLGIVPSWVGSSNAYMSWDQIKEMEELGCEIMSHSHTHRNFTNLSKVEQYEEFRISKRILRQKGFNPRGFVYPFNATDVSSREELPKFYEAGFAKTGYGNGTIEGRNTPNFANLEIARNALGSYFDVGVEGLPTDTTSLEYYKALVDDAEERENWLVFVLHSEPMDDIQLQHFRDTIDYIQSKGIDIVNPSDGFDIFGNIIEIPNKFTMDALGNVDSDSILVQRYSINSRSAKDSYTAFRNGKKSYTTISTAFATSEGFPRAAAGVLITDRIGQSEYNVRQVYRVGPPQTNVDRSYTYERFVNSDGSWTEWKNASGSITFDKTIPSMTVNANSSYDVEITGLDGLYGSDVVSITPFNTALIKPRTLYSVLGVSTGKVTLRFINFSSTNQNFDPIRFRINVLFT